MSAEINVGADGAGWTVTVETVKGAPLVAVPPAVCTLTVPVVAPTGTVTVNSVGRAAVTTAVTPLNLTVLLAGVAPKFVPVIIT